MANEAVNIFVHVIIQLFGADGPLRSNLVIWDGALCFTGRAGCNHSPWLQQQVLKDNPFRGNWENSPHSAVRFPESQTCQGRAARGVVGKLQLGSES